jgi:hypothetical protein
VLPDFLNASLFLILILHGMIRTRRELETKLIALGPP